MSPSADRAMHQPGHPMLLEVAREQSITAWFGCIRHNVGTQIESGPGKYTRHQSRHRALVLDGALAMQRLRLGAAPSLECRVFQSR